MQEMATALSEDVENDIVNDNMIELIIKLKLVVMSIPVHLTMN